MKTKNTIKTFEKFACNSLRCDRSELQWFIKNNPTRAIVLAEKYHKAKFKETIESVTDEMIVNFANGHKDFYKTKHQEAVKEAFAKGMITTKELLRRLDDSCDCTKPPFKYNEFGVCKYCGKIKDNE